MSKDLPLTSHLKELRSVLLVSIAAITVMTIIAYALLREPIMQLVVEPVSIYGIQLKFTGVAEAFMAYMKISILAGVILASPVVLWKVVAFILPGLYDNEKKTFLLIIFWLIVLFLIGIAFAYFVVLKYALKVLLFNFSGNFEPFITVNNYLSFIFKFLIPFGIVFEIPLLIFFLTSVGIITPSILTTYRRYIIVAIVIIAAVFSPPDVVSQMLLAIPMYFLFESSVLISKFVYKRKFEKNIEH